ncbi:MAG: glycosyltransferase family 2 protein [Acidobacteria bacterium]|nr:glycosyltransferase family 2 protein [Acidobacteriota bacterium]
MSGTSISVVTATRNRPQLLRRALLSIKAQTLSDFEVVVVDDGSPAEIQDEYATLWRELDGRFTLHHASPPGGPGSDPGRGRNFGVRQATGELVAFLDHDDYFVREDHLSAAVRAMMQGEAGYYFTHVCFDPPSRDLMWAVEPTRFNGHDRVGDARAVPIDAFLAVMRHSHIHPSHSVVRRSVWERAGGFIEGLRTADDVNFMLRIADLDPGILYRPDACVGIRMPEGSSFSLASGALAQLLAEVQSMVDIRARCRRSGVLRCARSRHAYALRQLALHLRTQGTGEPFRLAAEACAMWPSVGTVAFLLRTLINPRR